MQIITEKIVDEVMVITEPTKISGSISNYSGSLIIKDTEVEFDHGEISGGFLSKAQMIFTNTKFTEIGTDYKTPIIDFGANKTRIKNCTFTDINTPIIQSSLLGIYKSDKSETAKTFI